MPLNHSSSSTPFGIMQGRLVPQDGGRFQSFPRQQWRDEFTLAPKAGIQYVEWIYDAYGEDINALSSPEGIAELNALKQQTGVSTPAVCADWFMDFPFVRCTPAERAEREQRLHEILPRAAQIGADHMIIPCVDASRIATPDEKQAIVEIMLAAAPVAQAAGVELHLETDLNAADFAALLDRIPHAFVKANYDSGNSSGLGYVATEEFAAYGDRIGSIHIKDRYRKPEGGNETRALGLGSADLPAVFACMQNIGYNKGITLQVARGVEGDEVNWISQQLAYIRQYWQ
jgi:L-ribulose-5-phosphate 3-epimerase